MELRLPPGVSLDNEAARLSRLRVDCPNRTGPYLFGTHSLRRTRAILIYRRSGTKSAYLDFDSRRHIRALTANIPSHTSGSPAVSLATITSHIKPVRTRPRALVPADRSDDRLPTLGSLCSTVSDRPGSILDLLRPHRVLVGFDFPLFTGADIARTFFAAASMLGATSFYG